MEVERARERDKGYLEVCIAVALWIGVLFPDTRVGLWITAGWWGILWLILYGRKANR